MGVLLLCMGRERVSDAACTERVLSAVCMERVISGMHGELDGL